MPTAREIMTPDPTFCAADDAARQMADDGIGAVPVCSTEGRLAGIITDRDLAVQVIAAGLDPQTTMMGDLLDGSEVVTIGADDSAEEAIRTMKDHAVRRLPVIDGDRLVGMVSQADIARTMPDAKIGDLVGVISSAPPTGDGHQPDRRRPHLHQPRLRLPAPHRPTVLARRDLRVRVWSPLRTPRSESPRRRVCLNR